MELILNYFNVFYFSNAWAMFSFRCFWLETKFDPRRVQSFLGNRLELFDLDSFWQMAAVKVCPDVLPSSIWHETSLSIQKASAFLCKIIFGNLIDRLLVNLLLPFHNNVLTYSCQWIAQLTLYLFPENKLAIRILKLLMLVRFGRHCRF